MSYNPDNRVFVERLTASQPDLFGFVAAMLPFHSGDVDDLVQDVNLALIEQGDRYDVSRPFRPWMLAIARNKINAFLRQKYREKVAFDSDLVDRCAETLIDESGSEPENESVLRRLAVCRAKLAERHQKLINLRYNEGFSVTEIAQKTRENAKSVHDALVYARKKIADCLKRLCRLGDDPEAETRPADELDGLLGGLLDGDRPLTRSLEKALAANLKSSDEHVRRYLDQMVVHQLLARRFEGKASLFAVRAERRTTRKRVAFGLKAAAVLALFAGAGVCLRHLEMPLRQQRRECALAVAENPAAEGFSAAPAERIQPSVEVAEPPQPTAPEMAETADVHVSPSFTPEGAGTTHKEEAMKATTSMTRMETAVMALAVAATNSITALTAEAVDYAWLANPLSANWNATDANWNLGVWTNNAANTATFGESATREITVEDEVDASALNVTDGAYSFTGGQINLNGPFNVAEGASATVASALWQTNASSSARFDKTGAGALTLTGGTTSNVYSQLKQTAGTLIFNGGKHVVTKSTAATTDADVPFTHAGGEMRITGGATITLPKATTALNPDGVLNIENGTLTATNFLNAVSSSTGTSIVNIGDGGMLVANRITPSGATSPAATNTVCINVTTGGVLQVGNFNSSLQNNYGTIFFDGGKLLSPFGASTFFGDGPGKTHVKVGKGGFYVTASNLSRLNGPIESGAEEDGGFHVSGGPVLYLRGNNTYNGGTWLDGNCMLSIGGDSNLGKVPESPTNNIFFTKDSSIFFTDGTTTEVNKNRNILIASNVTANLAVIGTERSFILHGTISGDAPESGTNGAVRIVNNWQGGPVVFAPPADRTNQLGRLLLSRHDVIIASGTTLVTDKLGANAEGGSAAIDVFASTLFVTGGTFKVVNGTYAPLRGNLTVSGGLADFSGQNELLNAFRAPGTTTVCNAGIIDCNGLRLTQYHGTPDQALLNLCTGGIFRASWPVLVSDGPGNWYWPKGQINFNGGMLVPKITSESLLGNGGGEWKTNIFLYVREGGAVISNAYRLYIRNSLYSGAEKDGGLTKWGSGQLALCWTNTFNGPINVMQGEFTLGLASNTLYTGVTVNVHSGAWFNVNSETQTIARLEGSGGVTDNATKTGIMPLTVTQAVAPGEGTNALGTLTVWRKFWDLTGATLEIDVAQDGTCDVLSLQPLTDISQLSLKIMDQAKLNKSKIYTVINAPTGFTGEFKAIDVGKSWGVHYNHKTNKVEVYYKRGTVVMLM